MEVSQSAFPDRNLYESITKCLPW